MESKLLQQPEARRGHRWSFNDREVDDDEVSYASMGGPIKSPSNVGRFGQARQQGMSRYDTAALADRDYHGGVRGFDPLTIRIIKIVAIRLSIPMISFCVTGTSSTYIRRR